MPPKQRYNTTTILRKKKLRSNVIKKTRQAFLKTVNTNSHHNTIRKLIPMTYYMVMKQVSITNILHMALYYFLLLARYVPNVA